MADLEDLYSPFKGLSGHQGTQTLDQSYYDMLHIEDLQKRDRDQVVYKWFKKWQRPLDTDKLGPRYVFDKDRKQGRLTAKFLAEGRWSVNARNSPRDANCYTVGSVRSLHFHHEWKKESLRSSGTSQRPR